MALLGATMLAANAFAHDFWIAPSAFRIPVQTLVKLHLMLGPPESTEVVRRDPDRIRDFFTVSPSDQRVPVPGLDGADPAGLLRPREEGLWTVGYRSQDAFLELEAAKFEQYLREEGLEHVLDARREAKQSNEPGREIYSRCAKALLLVGAGGDARVRPEARLPARALRREGPLHPRTWSTFPFRLLRDNAGVAGILVAAIQRDAKGAVETKLDARTDATGRVAFALPKPGTWIVKCVSMARSKDPVRADWESLWATLTFEVPAPTAEPAPRETKR